MADKNDKPRPKPVPEPPERRPRESKPVRESENLMVFGTRNEKKENEK